MITSGNRPYFYEGTFPFNTSGNQHVGISGILFEQAMFALLAELDIYQSQLGITRNFTKYVNKEANKAYGFEPHNDGTSLVGISAESSGIKACINYKNYILDLRTRLSGLFPLIQTDSAYSDTEIALDYFQRFFGDNPSGSVGNWVHGPDLMNRGIYDIDLREVAYQPYTRIGKYSLTNTSGIKLPMKPIGPMFFTTAGQMLNVSDRDIGSAAQLDGDTIFAYMAAQSNLLAIQGDILVPDITKFYIWQSNNILSTTTGYCITSAVRTIDNGANEAFLGSGLGHFVVPNLSYTQGIYSLQLFNSSALINNMFSPVSGNIHIWPKLTNLVSSGYTRATMADGSNEVFTSGIHVFNTGFWQYSTSGALLQSPINGKYLWYRYADNQSWSTTDYGPKRWLDIASPPAMPITGINTKLCFYMGQTADLDPSVITADIRFVFSKYVASTLDYDSSHENPYSIPAAESPPSVDKFFFIYAHNPPSGVDLSNYYCISESAGLSSGPETYILNSDLDCVGAWDNGGNPAGVPIGMMNGHLYGFDPSQVSSSGATFTWQHIIFDDPGAVFPMSISSVGVVDTQVYIHELRDTVFDNTSNIGQLFEPINPNNFSFGGLPYILDPRGTDLDNGDGSVFVKFNAKMKGESVLKTFLGRINEGTVGGTGVIVITDFIPLGDGLPSWLYPIRV